MLNEKTSVLYQTRYCAQDNFSIALRMSRNIKRLEFNLVYLVTKKTKI